MLQGVYPATKKNGTSYYRSSITYKNKHISLGSFSSEQEAHQAYTDAVRILQTPSITIENIFHSKGRLSFEKVIILLNFRDNGVYIKNPIYLRSNFFTYYLSENDELKFDIDDLFYYSNHKIMRRKGHLFVNDYGMQVNLLSRYGIRNYSVVGRDYEFANGDTTDFRYSNLIVINKYYGVSRLEKNGRYVYKTQIHINGNFTVGTFSSEAEAAVAYNKAVDMCRQAGIEKNFFQNYVTEYSSKQYAELYIKIKVSRKFKKFLETRMLGTS